MTELKPCPFCGQEVVDYKTYCWCVERSCKISGKEFVIDNWNTRPIEDALTDENNKLRDLNKSLFEQLTKRTNTLLTEIERLLNANPQTLEACLHILGEIKSVVSDDPPSS